MNFIEIGKLVTSGNVDLSVGFIAYSKLLIQTLSDDDNQAQITIDAIETKFLANQFDITCRALNLIRTSGNEDANELIFAFDTLKTKITDPIALDCIEKTYEMVKAKEF